MNEINILKELATKIEFLDKNISDLKGTIGKEKSEMEEIENKINTLRAKYDLKKCEVSQLSNKLEDKLKIVNEAKRAYSRIVENTTRLIEAVDMETREEFYN